MTDISNPIGLNSLKPIDDQDTRKEMFILLQKLNRTERIEFLQWAVQLTNARRRWSGITIYVKEETGGEVAETYFDLCALGVHYGLSFTEVLPELERRARLKLIAAGAARP